MRESGVTALLNSMGLPGGLPWWTYLVVALACLAVYICRIIALYKIGSKALDKVSQDKVPEVVNSLTGYRGPRATAGKGRARAGRVGPQRPAGQAEPTNEGIAPGTGAP